MVPIRMLWMGVLVASAVLADEVPVEVTGSRVNLRARPDTGTEVVGQVSEGDVLLARSFQPDWVEIVPPDGTRAYVYAEYIREGRVDADTLNVRAGPGINYTVLGSLDRGAEVQMVRAFSDEWLEIEAPPATSLYIHFEYVERVRVEPAPSPGPFIPVDPTPVEPVADPGDAGPPRLPSFVHLVPLQGQGRTNEVTGELRKTPLLERRRFRFRLVEIRGNRTDTLAYLHGNEPQLDGLVGRRMAVRGPEYWVQEFSEPILVPEEIVLKKPE